MISLSNGEGSLDSLAVSDKRYHFNWFWKVLFVLCILTLCNLCCFFLQYRFGTFRTVIICELPNYSVTFFKRNKCLLFAWDIIYLELIYSCHMIFLQSVNRWILYPNLKRLSSRFSLGIQTHPRDAVYKSVDWWSRIMNY